MTNGFMIFKKISCLGICCFFLYALIMIVKRIIELVPMERSNALDLMIVVLIYIGMGCVYSACSLFYYGFLGREINV
jgi:hypothetical protein